MLTAPRTIWVPGAPAPKGSMKCVGQRGRHQLVDSLKATGPWMKRLTAAVEELWPDGEQARYHQPVRVTVEVVLERPAGHFTARGALTTRARDALPVAHGTGDLDKHLRAVLDALQAAGALDNDAQVVRFGAATGKRFAALGERSGVRVTVEPYEPETALVR